MPKTKRPLLERLNERVRENESGCWAWTGPTNFGGYGRFTVNGRTVMVHRFFYEAHIGPIPTGLQLDHLCRNRTCCNPAHLEPVTQRENILRGVSPSAIRARATHCIHGHPLSGENLLVVQNGERERRRCLTCSREYDKTRPARRRSAIRAMGAL